MSSPATDLPGLAAVLAQFGYAGALFALAMANVVVLRACYRTSSALAALGSGVFGATAGALFALSLPLFGVGA